MVIAVDIGASKVKLGAFAYESRSLHLKRVDRYTIEGVQSLGDMISRHLQEAGITKPQAISIGVAGPVDGETVKMTNLPWVLNAADIRSQFSCSQVYLVNDLEAHGNGIAMVEPEGFIKLKAGRARPGNQALIAAGTGLGQCILFRERDSHVAKASEGGHTDFAPRDEEQIELLQFMMKRHPDHVSWERIVSGRFGFRNLYEFYRDTGRISPSATLAERVNAHEDIGECICEAAHAGDPMAEKIVKTFVRLYGAEAGNLALKAMAVEGVYIAGGIARKIIPWMQDGEFVNSFLSKGRMSHVLEQMPVYLVKDPYVALKGLARYVLQRQ